MLKMGVIGVFISLTAMLFTVSSLHTLFFFCKFNFSIVFLFLVGGLLPAGPLSLNLLGLTRCSSDSLET